MRCLTLFFLFASQLQAQSTFIDDVQKASRSAVTRAASKAAGKLGVLGRTSEGNALLLATYPKTSRTVAQSFLLGNMLFRQDPATSYELHKAVVEQRPNEANAHLEWAMQQHRAGEFAGAAASYAAFGRLQPDFAPAWALQAECLIRLNKPNEAVAAWTKSEKAKSGSVLQFESMLCHIKLPHPNLKREQLLEKASKGDIVAARKLIALDCAFEIDWWNSPTERNLLKNDLIRLGKVEWKSKTDSDEVLTAAEAMLAEDAKNVAAILKKHGYLLDESNTLPHAGSMLSCMVSAVEDNGVLTTAQARKRWGEAILRQARDTKDVETFNVAAHLAVGTPELASIQREAWEVTNDRRFAAGLVIGLATANELSLEHPDLVAALKQFPEESMIARLEIIYAVREKKPLIDPTIRAIKAEYSRFSMQRLNLRRSARFLRSLFALLKKELEKLGDE